MFQDARSYFYKKEQGSEQYELSSSGTLHIDNLGGNLLVDYSELIKQGVHFNNAAFLESLNLDMASYCCTSFAETGGCVEKVSLITESRLHSPITGIKSGSITSGGQVTGHPAYASGGRVGNLGGGSGVTIIQKPSGSTTGLYTYRGSSSWSEWPSPHEGVASGTPYLSGDYSTVEDVRSCIKFFPYYDEKHTAYKLVYCDNDFKALPQERVFSVFGDKGQWAASYNTGYGYAYSDSITGHLYSGNDLPVVKGVTGFSLVGRGSSSTNSYHLNSGVESFIIAPGYFANEKPLHHNGFGYDENDLPSGSPSGEKITVTGIASGYYVDTGSFWFDGTGIKYVIDHKHHLQDPIPCERITGDYPVGVQGVSTSSIFTPLSSDSSYAETLTVKSLVGGGGGSRFFMSSGEAEYVESPSFVLHRGFEYLFDMSHVTNYLNTMRFGYRREALNVGHEADMISGWYELNVPGSTFAYNNYIIYSAPSEVALTVPITGTSHTYHFTDSVADEDHGHGNVGFYYGSNPETLAGVEKLIISDYNADNIRITGWTDSLSGIGEYVGVHSSGDHDIFASYLITDIEKTDTYRKINVNYINHNGSFSDGDKLVLSPSGDGRIYYYASAGVGYGGDGYFDITDSGNRTR